MTWFTIGAFVVLGVLIANSALVIARRRRMAAPTPQPGLVKQKVPAADVIALLVMAAAWVVGLGAPAFWPGSAFATFMRDRLNLVAYFIWCSLAYVVFRVVWYLLRDRPRS